MSKGFVTIEQHQCPICGELHDTGAVLMDKKLTERFEQTTVTGQSPCDECQKLIDDGFMALIEVTNTKSGKTLKQKDALRTGTVAWIRKTALQNSSDDYMAFCDTELMEQLKRNAKES